MLHPSTSSHRLTNGLALWQFRLELCQHNVKHGMRSADQALACAAVNGPQQNVGSSHGSKVCQRHYPSSPNLNPSGSKFHRFIQAGPRSQVDGPYTGQERDQKRVTPTYTNPICQTMLCYTGTKCSNIFRPSDIAKASTSTTTEHIQELEYKAHELIVNVN